MKNKLLLPITVLLIGILWFISVSVITLHDYNGVLRTFVYHDETDFSVRWKHSVEKEEWEEMFQVKGTTIYIDSTRFKTFGAGVPSNAGNNTFIKNGWVYMTGISRKIGDELFIRTGKTTQHRFIYGNETIHLDKQEAYNIRTEERSLANFIWLKVSTRMR
ncbi:DUF1850 domain-containing protein [Pontibacillus yanchengensis]|uniref:DUF1850 domain-containing protein n=1 Tax=Pontibacillus yanchengensis Y32 TaxID=1385514 RepID=A0A0A2TY28_9BACI|nr:DUF1850 domain-containing protein [Pontibacillus yanchengensis]KGP74180.1 hypothetical protein N782_09010 [Pontibacillus yanchengensis Y32]